MRLGARHYRKLMADLDAVGITTSIQRIGKSWYEVHVDYQIKKKYKLRKSANNFIKRLHKKHCDGRV